MIESLILLNILVSIVGFYFLFLRIEKISYAPLVKPPPEKLFPWTTKPKAGSNKPKVNDDEQAWRKENRIPT